MPDEIALETYIFINNYFNKILPTTYKIQLTLATDNHAYDTRWLPLGCLTVPFHKTELYKRNLVNIRAIYTRKYLQQQNDDNFILSIITKQAQICYKIIFDN